MPITFDYLVRAYIDASEAVDDYDVRDKNDPEWQRLLADQDRAKSAVFAFVIAETAKQQEEKQ